MLVCFNSFLAISPFRTLSNFQFNSVVQWWLTLCDPVGCHTPGLPVQNPHGRRSSRKPLRRPRALCGASERTGWCPECRVKIPGKRLNLLKPQFPFGPSGKMPFQADGRACAGERGHKVWHLGTQRAACAQRRVWRGGRDSAQVSRVQGMPGAGIVSGLLPC